MLHCFSRQSYKPRDQPATTWQPPVAREKCVFPNQWVTGCCRLQTLARWNQSRRPPYDCFGLWQIVACIFHARCCFVCKHLAATTKTSLWLLWLQADYHSWLSFACELLAKRYWNWKECDANQKWRTFAYKLLFLSSFRSLLRVVGKCMQTSQHFPCKLHVTTATC